VLLNCRVDPDVYEGFEAWRARQVDPETQESLTQAKAVRRLMRWALEQVGTVEELDDVSEGYAEGMRRGRADFHRVLEQTWKKLRGET
jgi:hypothetical protein